MEYIVCFSESKNLGPAELSFLPEGAIHCGSTTDSAIAEEGKSAGTQKGLLQRCGRPNDSGFDLDSFISCSCP